METHCVCNLVKVFIFTTVVYRIGSAKHNCKRAPYVCCLSWSTTNIEICDKCVAGYFGIKCQASCRYPNYGDLCQKSCSCTEPYCNHITGCQGIDDTV
uniref:Uncharacterized protein n=1 Tax=Magallana gigas TaxID=29159 RepID=A0A8W8JFB6_MAGGI